MADLTEEEKIVIGVCVGVGGLALLAIVIVLCYMLLRNKKNRKKSRRHYVKERFTDEYRPPPYDPMPLPYPPPLPPPPPPMPLVKIPPPAPVKVMYTDPYRDIEYRSSKWDGVFRNEPIVIPLAEPEYVTDGRYMQDPDTIYLKYNDDQALLRSQNYQRRTDYEPQPVRRARSFTGGRSFTVTKRETPYVGEWYRRADTLNDFNEDALRNGRDPFLWKQQRY